MLRTLNEPPTLIFSLLHRTTFSFEKLSMTTRSCVSTLIRLSVSHKKMVTNRMLSVPRRIRLYVRQCYACILCAYLLRALLGSIYRQTYAILNSRDMRHYRERCAVFRFGHDQTLCLALGPPRDGVSLRGPTYLCHRILYRLSLRGRPIHPLPHSAGNLMQGTPSNSGYSVFRTFSFGDPMRTNTISSADIIIRTLAVTSYAPTP